MCYTNLFLAIGFDVLLYSCTYYYSLTSELENLFNIYTPIYMMNINLCHISFKSIH